MRTALREGKPFVTDSTADVVDPGQIQKIESMLLPRQRAGSAGRLPGAEVQFPGSGGQFSGSDSNSPGLQVSSPARQAGSRSANQRSDATVGFANLYPVFSPDGKKLAFTSAKGGDYFGLSSLYVYDTVKKTETLVQRRCPHGAGLVAGRHEALLRPPDAGQSPLVAAVRHL